MGLYDQFQFRETQPISTYVGLPIDEAVRASEKLEDKYYTNLAARNSIDIALGTFDTIEGDRPGYESITSDIRQGLQEMAKRGDYENMGAKVSALATKFAADPRLHSMRKSYENYQKYMEDKNRFGAQGLDFAPKDFKSWDPETGKTQVFEGYVQERLPWEQEQAQIVDQLTPDSIFEDELHRLKGDFPGWLYTEQGQALTADKVRKYIDEQGGLDRYKDTASYKQQRAYMLHQLQQQGVEPTDEILQEFDEGIRDRLVATGVERVFSQTQKRFMTDPMAVAGYEAALANKAVSSVSSEYVTNMGRSLIGSYYDPESKEIQDGTLATTQDLLDEGFSKADVDGKDMISIQGDIIIDPGIKGDPDVQAKAEKAREVMNNLGSGTAKAYADYKQSENTVTQVTSELPDMLSDLEYAINQAYNAGEISQGEYKGVLNHYANIDFNNIVDWKPYKGGVFETTSPSRDINSLVSSVIGEREESVYDKYKNTLKQVNNSLETLSDATSFINNQKNKSLYEGALEKLEDDDRKILSENSKYLGPEYTQEFGSKIGEALNNLGVVAEPIVSNNGNTVRLEDGTAVTKMMATITDDQLAAMDKDAGWFASPVKNMLQRSGNLKKSGDETYTFTFYVPRKASRSSMKRFDESVNEGKQLERVEVQQKDMDRDILEMFENQRHMMSSDKDLRTNPEVYSGLKTLLDMALMVSEYNKSVARTMIMNTRYIMENPDKWDGFLEDLNNRKLEEYYMNMAKGQ